MYFIARTKSGRPSLMHRLNSGHTEMTVCGHWADGWAKAYRQVPIQEVLCKKCKRAYEREGY